MQKITALMMGGCLVALSVSAQSNIIRVEYFFNSDPGFGNASPIAVAPDTNIQNQPASLPVSALPAGLNTLFIRSASANGVWSITNSLLFLKTSRPPLPNIIAAEYFVDVDPGFGKSTPIVLTPDTNVAGTHVPIDVSGNKPGLHTLFIRSKDANGKWSITNNFLFLKTVLPSNTNVIAAEYFIDNDPGFGNAQPISIASNPDVAGTAVPVNISSVSLGLHTLFIRSKDANGKWSITNSFLFYKTTNTLYNIVQAEYFIDKDPGFGNGTKVPSINPSVNNSNVTFAIDIRTLDSGAHQFFIRSKALSGKWSITNYFQFTKTSPPLPVTWLSFEAVPLQKEVLLQWKTASEQNSSYFEIDYSLDGTTFTNIGKVAAAGYSSSVSNYEFTHTSPNTNGANYYRIKQFDKDGRFTYSPIRITRLESTPAFTVWPNPVRGNLTIYSTEQGLTVHVFDAGGKNLITQKIISYTTSINLKTLAGGLYYIVAEKEGKLAYTKKILKD